LLQIPIDLRFNGKNKGIIASYCLLSKDYEWHKTKRHTGYGKSKHQPR
jgi:hypothetical protein